MQKKVAKKAIFGGSMLVALTCCALFSFAFMTPTRATASDTDDLRFGDRIDPVESPEEFEAYDQAEKARSEQQKQQYIDEVQTNEYGLTYGSSLAGDPFTGEGVPDLISVRASNGQDGYMYFKEWNAVHELDLTITPEELEETSKTKRERVADEFVKLIEDAYGCKLISESEAVFVCNKIARGEDYAVMHDYVAKTIAERVESNLDADGKQIVQSIGDAHSTESSVIQKLAEISGSANTSDPESLMDFNQFVMLYQAAYGSVGVPIPVYLSDGKTQIGVYYVDTLG